MANHKVKSEMGSVAPKDFVGLRAKMYSLDCGEKSQKKGIGIKRHYVEKNVRHRDFLTILKREKLTTVAQFSTFKSTNHVLTIPYRCRSCASMCSTISVSFSKMELTRYHMIITALFESLCICFVHMETFWWRSTCVYTCFLCLVSSVVHTWLWRITLSVT